MEHRLRLTAFLLLLPLISFAQRITLTGSVTDATDGGPLPGTSVVLLSPKDSTQVTGISTDDQGKFRLTDVKAGKYIMRLTFVGYITQWKNITLEKGKKEVNMGTIALKENASLLKEAEVVTSVAQVEMKADTFVYNADTYKLPEGSALEELVKKLPGAEVSDDGTIKINGKTVSKVMVEGKEFFEKDTKMAMKNLPTKMVKKIKAYDKKSDYTRITGIDDGEEETVLDLTVKKEMKEGWMVNVDLGYGTEDRYTGKANVNRFLDHSQFSVILSRNNVNDNGFGWGGPRWGRGGGITTSTMAGANFWWDNGKPDYTAGLFKVGGNIRYSHSKSNSLSKSNSETFLDNVHSTFSNQMSQSLNKSANVNIGLRLEWMPDSMTNIFFRPSFSHSESSNRGASQSVTFNDDPYATYDGITMTDPLNQYNMEENRMIRDSIAVNDNLRSSMSDSHSNNVEGRVQVNRRLQKPGRNVTLNLGGSYSESQSESFSRSEINYFQRGGSNFTNQYITAPSKSYSYQARFSYTEPIIGALNLQLSYQFQYRYSDNDRSMYSIDSLLTKFGGYYTQEQLYLGYIPGLDSLNYCYNAENSQYATYKEYNHAANLMFRYNLGENRLNFGVSVQPQTTHMDYLKNWLDTTVVRHTFNWAPRIDYRWKISNTSQLRVRFNGRMSQPSITDLLEVTDNSDPLNISTGNSGLRSSWQNNLDLFYNAYVTEKQRGWMINARYTQMRNNISSATIYNTETGARYTRPMNIDGNWNTGGAVMFNTAMGRKKYFNIHTFTNLSHNHNVGYLSSNSDGSNWSNIYLPNGNVDMDYIFSTTPLQKATTKTTNISENLRLNFRNDLMEVGVNGGVNYQHARSALQKNANMDNWSFNYGGNLTINAPWGTSLSTDIGEQCRRGYEDASMNTNELIWNAQLSQSFLKDRAATISVQWYDILRERSSISRSISATMRSDSWTNAIHSYVMVHFIYKLNLMGSKGSRIQGMGGQGGPGGERGGRGGGGGGRF